MPWTETPGTGSLTIDGVLSVALGTITTDVKVFDGSATWNAAGVTFTGLKLNVTDTASAVLSLLADLQVGGTSKFSVRKDGQVSTAGSLVPLSNDALDIGLATTARWRNLHLGQMTARGPRPWVDVRAYGATGDLVTNDSASFQTAIDALGATGGGTVFIPQGNYLLNTGLTITGRGIRILGDSAISPYLQTDTLGVTQWTVTGAQNTFSGLQIGMPKSTAGGNTGAAISLGTGAVETHIDTVLMAGGARGILVSATSADTIISRCKVSDTYGGSLIKLVGSGAGSGGVYLFRNKLDQVWPVSTPTTAQILGAWTATTVFTVGQVVTTGGVRLQCSTAGTSGGVAPTIGIYGANITDGTVVWKLAMIDAAASLLIDSNVFGVWGQWNDMTGAFIYGVRLVNTVGAGTAPQKVMLQENEVSACVQAGIQADAGDGLIIRGNTINNTISGDGIFLNNTTDGDVLIEGNLMYGHSQHGIQVANGVTHTSILNNHLNANGIASIQIASNTTDFIIKGNNTNPAAGAWSGAQAIGIRVAAGTSTRYIIMGNHGSNNTTPVSDGGTGTSKVVTRNLGYVTENSGATSIADGGTITHGLATTPAKVRVTPTVAGNMASVTAVGATTFTVALKLHDGTAGSTQTVYWAAEI